MNDYHFSDFFSDEIGYSETDVIDHLMTAVASSAGVERVF